MHYALWAGIKCESAKVSKYKMQKCMRKGNWPFRSSALSLPWNFRSVEHSLQGSEKYKNFRSMELSLLWNFRSSGGNVPKLSFHGTFAPLEPSLHKQLSCPLTFAHVELSLPYTVRKRGIIYRIMRGR